MPGDRGEFGHAAAPSALTFGEDPGQGKQARAIGAPVHGQLVRALSRAAAYRRGGAARPARAGYSAAQAGRRRPRGHTRWCGPGRGQPGRGRRSRPPAPGRAATRPAEAPPADARQADGGPSGTGPADSAPADGGPSGTGPADGGPSGTGPADGGPFGTGPADSAPADGGPSGTGPADG